MSLPCPDCGRHHESKCHRCPHNSDRASGKFTGRPWAKTPCSACVASGDGSAVSHKMRSHVSLDCDGGLCHADLVHVTSRQQEPSERTEHALEEFMLFILELARLDMKTRDVSLLRLLHELGDQKWEYSTIAKRHKLTTQAAEQMHRKAIERSPILQRVFKWKLQKQAVRIKPKAKVG